MMLTAKQPVQHGYRPVHDLPTPPRSSPPLSVQDSLQKPYLALPQKQSPSTKPMSAPHRGLPLPAAMTLTQPPPPPGPPHPSAPGPPLHAQGPPAPSPHSQALGALPAPPQHQSEDSMRSWLIAKAEEEKRKQEEEKTRQETLRLEQRRLEYDMLRTSLDRGIPPPMVPVVFAGMSGGTLPQVALEWAQQYLAPQPVHAAQIMPAQGGLSPETRRESQPYGGQQYAATIGVPSTPGSGTGTQASFVPYPGPGSPRPRAHTLSMGGAVGRPLGSSALPRLSTGEGAVGPSGIPHQAHTLTQQQTAAPQQDTQSPSIYFHHWQPPTTQGGSNQPGTPSVESPKKRKATGPQQAAPPPTQARFRSPPFGQQSTLSNPPPGRRRGHSRQRSDISSYRSAGRGRMEPFGPHRGLSPGLSAPREAGVGEPSQHPRSGAHSVSSLLSDQPSPRYASEIRAQQSESSRRNSPVVSDERSRGGAAGVGSATGHPGPGREND